MSPEKCKQGKKRNPEKLQRKKQYLGKKIKLNFGKYKTDFIGPYIWHLWSVHFNTLAAVILQCRQEKSVDKMTTSVNDRSV